MKDEVKDRVQVRLFLGFLLPVDQKFQLQRSIQWKQATIEHAGSDNFLEVVRYRDAEYIGKYQDSPMLSLEQVRKGSQDIKENLKIYAPHFDVEEVKIALFPQVFVS